MADTSTQRRLPTILPVFLAAIALWIPFWATQAIAALWLLYWLPGAAFLSVTGWGREWERGGRCILAPATSVLLVPLVLNPIWHWTDDGRIACTLIAGIGLVALLCMRQPQSPASGASETIGQRPRPLFRSRIGTAALPLIAAWVGASVLFSYWPNDIGKGPIPQTGIHDYIKHHAILLELEHTLPLGNPFFADGAHEPVYYYHFFYLAPAAIRSAAGGAVSIALVFGLSAAIVAAALVGMAYLFIKRLTDSDAAGVLAALLVGPIGGFDILPLLVQQKFVVTLDAWADTPLRVHNLLTQLVWTPQNSQGLLVGLVGAYGLSSRGVFWRGWVLVAPLLAASLLGTSVWVSAMVLPGAAIIALWQILKRAARPAVRLKRIGAAAGIALLTVGLAAPTLAGYLETSRRHGKSLTLVWDAHSKNAVLGTWVKPGMTANLLDLPWILFFEFGPLLVLPLLLRRESWRRANADAGLSLLMMTSVLALVAFAGVRSHFTYNDFGHRAIMIPLLTGALLGSLVACQFRSRSTGSREPSPGGLHDSGNASTPTATGRWGRRIAVTSLLLGLPVGLWQAPATAARRFVEYGESVAAKEAGALRYLRDALPRDAVAQGACDDSERTRSTRLSLCQLIDRQIGVLELQEDTHVFQGRDGSLQAQTLAEFRGVLERPASAADRHAALRRHGVTHVLLGVAERERWVDLGTFDDAAFFRTIFDDGGGRVVELR
ncbi:MAG: hypothetical protein IT450_20090 [Phycisphaerales bacterium]|nr:hypothetical protein [Phycisphaerales bacterium]